MRTAWKEAQQRESLSFLFLKVCLFFQSTIQDLFNVDVSETDASRRMAEVLADRERRAIEVETVSLKEEGFDTDCVRSGLLFLRFVVVELQILVQELSFVHKS